MRAAFLGPLLLAACAACCAQDRSDSQQPEASTAITRKPGWTTSQFAVAAANPLAVQAGTQILRDGGSAVDAAVAVQMVLTLVEPQSSGIGGGAFLLHFDGRRTQAFDGRETAPAAASEKLFLGPDGEPLGFFAAVVGGRAVGTPGTLRMLELAHRQHGQLPWRRLFAPAIALATNGFAVSARLNTLLEQDPYLRQDPVAAAYFYDAQGKAWPEGHWLKNPELAAVFQRIADQGAQAFYTGELAQATVSKVRQHSRNPGTLTLADLANYRAIEREPLCFDHAAQGRNFSICGMPPPSSGALALGQIMGLLAFTPAETQALSPAAGGPAPAAQWLHLYTEASRLAFADRALYLGDPDFVAPPAGDWMSLLAPAYLKERARLIGTAPQDSSMKTALPGKPGERQSRYAPMAEQPEHGTSHLSIVDARGRVLAMTTTIENAFGARQMVNRGQGLSGGFLLNNELTDFSFAPTDAQGLPFANRVQPLKRPRSSMSPTLVFDKTSGKPVLSLGSPGGNFIIHFVAKTLYGVLHWGLDAQAAINLPNFGAFQGPTLLETGRFSDATVDTLNARGHRVRQMPLTSGIQAIQIGPTGLSGGADPRREGVVMGD